MADANLSSLYSRQDLYGRRIRVLDLHPTRPGTKAPLSGTLRTVSLDQNTSFSTLSYCWGPDSQSPSQNITCAGHEIPITQNCHDALSTLSSHFKVQTIWVDAICINQNDDPEKGLQIPLMKDIYGKAKRVYIWLGNGTEMSDEALDWIVRDSKYDEVFMAAKFKAFPAIMMPGEIGKLFRLFAVLWCKSDQ